MCNVLGKPDKGCCAPDFSVILDQHTILQNRDVCRNGNTAVFAEPGSLVYDIVGLPFTRLPACVYKRNTLFVNRSGLAVGIGSVVITVQYL